MVLQTGSMKEVSMRIGQGGPRVLIAERCYEEGQGGRRWTGEVKGEESM